MFQPTNSTKKDNNLGLPPKPPLLKELADKQESPVMGAGRVIVPVSTLSKKSTTTDKVSAAPVPAGASIERNLFVQSPHSCFVTIA
jgi:hypothetical protein